MKIVTMGLLLFAISACSCMKNKCSGGSCEKKDSCSKTEVNGGIAYEGSCAMGMCLKKKVDGNPAYKVDYRGKCYIFSSMEARDNFLSSIDENIKKADLHWKQIGIDRVR